jgi:23S rRNA (uracil1939-C5)-methyltransferase
MTTRLHCPHSRECGACSLLDTEYGAQLLRKHSVLGRALGKHPGLRGLEPLPCLPSPRQDGYRNRAKMAIGISRHGGVDVGYFRAGTREIVSAPDCRVLIPELAETTRRIRRFLETASKIPRTLRHVDVRCGSDPARHHLTLVFRAQKVPAFPLDALRSRCRAISGISVNLNPATDAQVIRGSVRPLWGEREIWVEHAGLRFRVSPAAFFQVNLSLLPTIHELMARFFQRGDVLADLYAGVGTHGLALARRFRRVFFAEGNRSAVADLKATIRGIAETEFLISPVAVERGLARLREAAPDAVVLNPSRAGARETVLDALSECPVTKLAYLSCDPTSLCRDLDFLRLKGFSIRSVQPIDMMPQTGHVEALALLTRTRGARASR